MKHKRFISVVLAMLLVLSMGGCGQRGEDVLTEATGSGAAADRSDATVPGAELSAEGGVTEATEPSETVEATESTNAGATAEATEETVADSTKASEPEATQEPVTQQKATEPAATEPTETAPQPTNPPAPAHEHSYTQSYVPPACETFGYYLYSCSCGHSYKEEDTSIPPNDHEYTREYSPIPDNFWSENVTCTCVNCGYVHTGVVHAREIDPAIIDQIEARTIDYINQYRQAEGVPACSAPPVFQLVADMRAKQLLSNFSHSETDLRAACAAYQYGTYVDATQYGDDASLSYYTFGGSEAIANGFKHEGIDGTAKYLADLIYGSKNHWHYIGSADKITIAVGIACIPNNIVGAVLVSAENYG